MRLMPASYNGFIFQQSPDTASCFDVPFDWTIRGLSTNSIQRSNNFPVFSSKGYAGTIKVIEVTLNDVNNIRDSLVIAMDILGEGQKQLIALDELGRQWYVNAVCLGMNEEGTSENTATFGMTFECDDPIWKKVTPSTQTISVNVTGSGTITPLGNQYALPVITITPTVSGGVGFAYKKFIQIINNSLNALANYPINLTGAGLDTAALVSDNANKCLLNGAINASVTTITYDTVTGSIPSAGSIYVGTEQISYTSKSGTQFLGCVRGINGTTAASHLDNDITYTSKMAADGNDFRIYVDGVEVKRWFNGINTSTTKVWINWTQPANTNMTLGATIAATGAVSTITIQNTAGNVALMPTIPTSGNVLIGSEIFVYTGVNVAGLTLTGCTRAERQTTAGAHAIADAVKFVTHDVWMYYGSPLLSAYIVDDTYKPIIKLTSTNTSWIYEEFGTGPSTGVGSGLRTASWEKLSPNPYAYITAPWGIPDTSPWTAMGPILRTGFGLYNPCGFTTVTATGEKVWTENFFTPVWVVYTFEKSTDGVSYANVWTESAPPVGFISATALDSHSAVALGATYNYLRFVSPETTAQSCRCMFLDMTLAIDATKVPTINLATEASNFVLNSTLINAATGYSITISLSMTLGTSITVDTKNKTVTLYDGSNQINALQNMPIRLEWFPLLPSRANVITITDLAQVTYAFSYEDRTL